MERKLSAAPVNYGKEALGRGYPKFDENWHKIRGRIVKSWLQIFKKKQAIYSKEKHIYGQFHSLKLKYVIYSAP